MKKTLLLKTMLLLCAFIVGSSSAWADEKSTLTFTEACGGSGTANDGVEWTVTSDANESLFDGTKGIHYGTSSVHVKYIQLSTSDISGTITSVKVNASTASGVTATVSVTVGGNAFGGDAKSITATATDYTFTGEATGGIIVKVEKPSKAAKALYVKSIEVTYSEGSPKTPNDLAWSTDSKDVTYGDTPYNLPTLSNPHNLSITYDSSDKSVATIDNGGNVTVNNVTGTTTISAYTSGDDTYASGTVTYTLNVTRVSIIEDGVFDFTTGEDYGSGLAKSGVKVQSSTWIAGNTTMLMTGRNCWNDYTDGSQVRLYKANNDDPAGSIKLSVPAGYVITGVAFTGASLHKMGAEDGDYDVASTNKTATWTGSANSVTFTAIDRTDIYTITVSYAVEVTISDAGYATFSNASAVDFSSNTGLSVYYVSSTAGNKAEMVEIGSKKVPANTGVLLKGAAGNYSGAVTTGVDPLVGNLLFACVDGYDATVDNEIYILANGTSGVGFYPIKGGTSLGAGKAYIGGGDVNAKCLTLSFENETTAINGVEEVAPANVKTRKVVKNGRLVIETANGEFTIDGARVK